MVSGKDDLEMAELANHHSLITALMLSLFSLLSFRATAADRQLILLTSEYECLI